MPVRPSSIASSRKTRAAVRKALDLKPRPVKARLRALDDPAALANVHARLDEINRELRVQFTRIAQLQADLDLMRAAWARVEGKDSAHGRR